MSNENKMKNEPSSPKYEVNLPVTDFPMRADLAKREPTIGAVWQTDKFKEILTKTCNKRAKKYILHDGPPYANGDIHLGHALNKVLKDIAIKSKFLSGFAAPYVPGWDCHGLPIELNVEKQLGKPGQKVTKEEFIAACRDYADQNVKLQMASFQRLGVLGDWQNHYATNNYQYEANIVRALGKIIGNGYLESGFKPVHWCVACESALAEAEVEYKNKVSPAIDVRFVVDNCSDKIAGFKLKKSIPIVVPIWTTTPWTLLANEAVALRRDFSYQLIDCGKEYLLLVKELTEQALLRYGYQVDKCPIQATFLGENLADLKLRHPFLKKVVPVILADHVTNDVGTGAVHTAPAHGQEDYKAGCKYHLPVNNPVDSRGKFFMDVPFVGGLDVFAANEKIIKLLEEQSNLLAAKTIEHSYPHCWRHKKPLIFRATQQWFVSLDKVGNDGETLRQKTIRAVEEVEWLAPNGKERMLKMVVERPDWCISRQRVYNTPMPLFVHKKTGALHPETSRLIEIVAKSIEQEGAVYWQKLDGESFLNAHVKDYPVQDYQKINDTLDVWFDAGVSHFCVAKQHSELKFPADLYLEGSDQYRGWFQSSLLTSVALHNHAPYKAVLCHGFTLDVEGHKMSKSLGNVISPQEIIAIYGADILRLWAASAYFFDDLTISKEILARNVDAYRMLRNTARFLLGNLHDFNVDKDLVPSQVNSEAGSMLAFDLLAVKEMLDLAKRAQDAYAKYNFFEVMNVLQAKIAAFYSSYYFSVIKDRLYVMPKKSLGRRSAQTALYHILHIFVRLIAPVTSFTAEEIWQEMRKLGFVDSKDENNLSVFLSTWYDQIKIEDFDLAKEKVTAHDWQEIKNCRDAVNKELEDLRASGKIGSSLNADIVLYCDEKYYQLLQKLGNELHFIFITSTATIKDLKDLPKTAKETNLPGLWILAEPSSHPKCSRCWHQSDEVGKIKEHGEICDRCAKNLFGPGEVRKYV